MVTFAGQSCVTESHTPDADITQCGMEVWGNLTLRGTGSLVSARFVMPAGGSFGAGGVVDASGAVAPHVMVEPDVASSPAGETNARDVTGDNAGKFSASAGPAAGEPTAGHTVNPALKPAAVPIKTTSTVTKTTVSTPSKPKPTTTTAATLPKTADSNWIVVSFTLLLLGLGHLAAAYRY